MRALTTLHFPLLRTTLALGSMCLVATPGCVDPKPLEDEIAKLDKELVETKTALAAAEAALPDEKDVEERNQELSDAEQKISELELKLKAAKGEKGILQSELQKKEKALEAVKALEDALATTLVAEVEAGEISVKERNGYLVVNVSDKVLFPSGSADLSKRGEKVIAKLAESLKALPEKSVFQVGGHTDNQPIKSDDVLAKFPTNWELSAARATNVVRYLEETCEVPGERLVAAGFSEFRPVANNRKPRNRKKNRRIEIALLPPRE